MNYLKHITAGQTLRALLLALVVGVASTTNANAFLGNVFDFFDPDRVILEDEIRIGNIELDVNGVNEYHGHSLEGLLINTTDRDKRIRVTLDKPLFMENEAPRAQDMVVTRVYRDISGAISSREDDDGRYVLARAGERVPVKLVAYCGDRYNKNAPSLSDNFTIGTLSDEHRAVTEMLKEFRAKYENTDMFNAAQALLWKRKGVPMDKISHRLDLDKRDIFLMTFMNILLTQK